MNKDNINKMIKSVRKPLKKSVRKSVRKSPKKSPKKIMRKSPKKSVGKYPETSLEDLKKLAKKYGQSTSGTKKDLAKRPLL